MRIHLYIALATLVAGAYAEDVALKGGAKIQAPLLKNADDAVVLDLGYDVLRVPRNEVLAVYENRQAVEGTVPDDTNRLYTVQSPERITTTEAPSSTPPPSPSSKPPPALAPASSSTRRAT